MAAGATERKRVRHKENGKCNVFFLSCKRGYD